MPSLIPEIGSCYGSHPIYVLGFIVPCGCLLDCPLQSVPSTRLSKNPQFMSSRIQYPFGSKGEVIVLLQPN